LDEFFQNLREIQKKERSLSSLSPVGDDFYQQISNYFNRLMKRIDNNPFSFESYLLRDAQRIVVEICERREHKITNSAVMNVQRSYQIFKDIKEDGRPNIPLNSTPEEEKLYMELYRYLANYREEMRSPLRSYSNKKDITSKKLSSTVSKQFEGEFDPIVENTPDIQNNIIDGEVEVNKGPSNKGHSTAENPLSKEIRTNSSFADEIPPEIQDEIYKEFGKEPLKQGSKDSSDSSKEMGNTEVKNYSSTSNDLKGKTENLPGTALGVSKNIPNVQKTSTEVLMILDEMPSIMGVDSKVYGPFYPGDIITMPEPNARILIKNHKGKSIQRYK
jgi:DNA replication factor GINS